MKQFFLILGILLAGLPSPASGQEEEPDAEAEVDTEVEVKPAKPKKKVRSAEKSPPELFTGIGMMSPEIVPAEFMVRFKKTFLLRTYFAPAVARFQMPFDVAAYEFRSTLFKVYSPYQRLTANVTYGPHFGTEAWIFPGSERFYLGGGIGVRQITADIDDTLDYYVCLTADANCGSSGNPSRVRLTGSATSTSWLARAALGWLFLPTGRSYINVTAIGISYPFSRSMRQNLDVTLEKNDLPSWVNSSLNAALNSSLDPYEEEIADGLYDAYGREYDTQPLPVTGISGGIYF